MDRAISETERRRKIQIDFNKKHGITPKTIAKKIHDITEHMQTDHQKTVSKLLLIDELEFAKNPSKLIKAKEQQMEDAVKILDFETAAILRDEIKELSSRVLKKQKQEEKAKKEATKGIRARKQMLE